MDLNKEIKSYLTWSPVSLVIRETCRIFALKTYLEKHSTCLTILDVGCGDGKWWQFINTSQNYQIDGIDINVKEVQKAREFIKAEVMDISSSDFRSTRERYDLVIGNCSMEHIPNIDQALSNIARLLKNDSGLVIFVPTPVWAMKGKSLRFLNYISPRLSMMYSGMINGFFQHWHLYHYQIWSHILERNGFVVVDVKGLGSARLDFLFRLFLPLSFISYLVKIFSGNYLIFYLKWLVPDKIFSGFAMMLNSLVCQSFKSADDVEEIFEYMIVAKKLV